MIELDLAQFPHVERWVKRIEGREAVKRGVSLPPGVESLTQRRELFKNMRKRIDGLAGEDMC